MVHPDHLKQLYRLSLMPIHRWTKSAEKALLMIAAHESHMGKYLEQNGGPALGIHGVEPRTMRDNYTNYLDRRSSLAQQIIDIAGVSGPCEKALRDNPLYNTIHARLWLWRSSKEKLPEADKLTAIAIYLANNYNSKLGKATPKKYLNDYYRYVL